MKFKTRTNKCKITLIISSLYGHNFKLILKDNDFQHNTYKIQCNIINIIVIIIIKHDKQLHHLN